MSYNPNWNDLVSRATKYIVSTGKEEVGGAAKWETAVWKECVSHRWERKSRIHRGFTRKPGREEEMCEQSQALDGERDDVASWEQFRPGTTWHSQPAPARICPAFRRADNTLRGSILGSASSRQASCRPISHVVYNMSGDTTPEEGLETEIRV